MTLSQQTLLEVSGAFKIAKYNNGYKATARYFRDVTNLKFKRG